MHPFQVLLVLFAGLSIAAFVVLLRWERARFTRLGKGNAWWVVRLASIPIAAGSAALVLIPASNTRGMEGLAVFYILLLTLAPMFWFGAHWLAGRLAHPRLSGGEAAQIAVSPIALAIVLVLLAHKLQPMAWSLLRSAGLE